TQAARHAEGLQALEHLVGVVAEPLFHRLDDDADEAVAALVAPPDERLDDPADLAQRVADARGVLGRKLGDLDGVPDDVVAAALLEPERRDAQRPAAHLAVPDEEAGGERLALDLGPAGRV